MAKPIITEENMNEKLRELVSKYGDDFRRLRRDDRFKVLRNFFRIPLWAAGVYDPMELPTQGYDEAYVRQQQQRDNDLARLDILAKHKRQLMELEEAGMRGSTQHKMAEAQALRSLVLIDVSRNRALSAKQVAKIEQKTAYHTQMSMAATRTLGNISDERGKAASRARTLAVKTGSLKGTDLLLQVTADMETLGEDPHAQQAYIDLMRARANYDVLKSIDADAYAKAGKNRGPQKEFINPDTATFKQNLTAIKTEEEEAEKTLKKHNDAMGSISAGFGWDETVMNTVKAHLTVLMYGKPETDVTKAKSVGTVADDLVEEEYDRLTREQKEADAKRTPTYWAEIEALIDNSPEFKTLYLEKGEPYGMTKLEFFKDLMKVDKKLDKEERQRGEKEQGFAKGIERAERVAAGEDLNSSAVERLVAKMRVGMNKAKRYITGDKSGRSEELDEDLLDLSSVPEGKEQVEALREGEPEEEPKRREDTKDIDLLREPADDPDLRAGKDNPSAEVTAGANADSESPQQENTPPKDTRTDEEKAKSDRKKAETDSVLTEALK